jgi:hypothetical protein
MRSILELHPHHSQSFVTCANWRTITNLLILIALVMSQLETSIFAAIDVVVSTGHDSPDGNGELTLHYAPTINAAGQLAFVSDLVGTTGGTTDNHAVFRRETSGELTLIARRGQTFNGQPINTFFPTNANIDSSGTVSPILALGPPTVLLHVFGEGGALTPMYEAGSPSPSGNNTLLGVLNAATNDDGVSIFRAVYNGANPESGIYQRATNGALTTRLLQNSPAPRGGTISGFFSRPTINESRQIAVIMNVNTGDTSVQSAVRIDGTTAHELVREGDLLADGMTTVTDVKPATAFVSDGGQLAFAAAYSRPGSIGEAIFRSDEGGTTFLAGGLLPGGTTAATNVQLLGISAAGRVALTSEFLGGSDPLSGIYVADTAGPTLVAFEDSATPVPGKYFRSFFTEAAVMNDTGQLAFLADLSDVANGPSTGRGLYFYDPASGLQQIARTGDELEGSTITGIYFFGTISGNSLQSPDTSHSGLNSAGQVAFAFTLATAQDGLGIWSAANIPGDYNDDGTVDAADYVVWRKHSGTSTTLPNDEIGGMIGTPQYDQWRMNFGPPAGAGATVSATTTSTVPEPATLLLFVVGFAAAIAYRS